MVLCSLGIKSLDYGLEVTNPLPCNTSVELHRRTSHMSMSLAATLGRKIIKDSISSTKYERLE